jgi:hypothetical protein
MWIGLPARREAAWNDRWFARSLKILCLLLLRRRLVADEFMFSLTLACQVCAMAAFLDDAIGNITGAISRAGLTDQTLVVFTSGWCLRLPCVPLG